MHDIIFSKAILREINEIKDKDKKINSVYLELGELVGIEKQVLKETLKKISGINFEIFTVDSRVRCECGYEGRAKIEQKLHDLVIFTCPKCNNIPSVLTGDKVKIVKIIYK
jgi:Zn finger protein HypA/HybF involved in hydrogenase expression